MAAGYITKADQILPYFVINELPAGLPGLLIAAIFAASMSTTSSGINALTTTTLIDFHQRLWRKSSEAEAAKLSLARWLTIGYGVLVILLAFWVSRFASLIETSNRVNGVVGGPLLGLFLLGILVRRANAIGAVIGWLAGMVVLYPIVSYTKTSFLWYGVVGLGITVSVGWLASLLFPAPTVPAENGDKGSQATSR